MATFDVVFRILNKAGSAFIEPLTREELDLAPVVVDEPEGLIIAKSGQTNSAGPFSVATPGAGKAIRLWWYNIGAHPDNGATAVVSLRFGAAGVDFYKTALSKYGAATAHSFKSGKSYVQGDVDQPLVLILDVAQQVYINIDYEEVTP